MKFFRRRLPHLHAIGHPIFLTWRLHNSLPTHRPFPSTLTSGKAFLAMDRLLDTARTGPLYLRRPEIAQIVIDSIFYCENRMYDLHSYVIMPNHVHLLITPNVEVSKITQSLKRATARAANQALGLTGPFWQDESYDRLVRDQPEFDRVRRYIEWNPVKAGLAPSPEEFPWSSVGQACSLRAELNSALAGRSATPPPVTNRPHRPTTEHHNLEND